METLALSRHELVKRLTARDSGKVAETACDLWGPLSVEISSIIGDAGFDSLYARSVFLTQTQYPWLAAGSAAPTADQRFAPLQTSLEEQTTALALEANTLLLIIFTDILASMLGEPLTARILNSAWGHDAKHRTGKEIMK